MSYLTKQKELIPHILIIAVFIYAGFNLFSKQVEASQFAKAGATVLPSYVPGGAGRCNIPTYEDYYNKPVFLEDAKEQSGDISDPATNNTDPAERSG